MDSTFSTARRYPRISLPQGMPIAWYGGGDQQVSRVKTLGMGGLFISSPNPPPVGSKLMLAFDVPGGSIQADGVVRNLAPGEGMGVEFTDIAPQGRPLLEGLLKRLLR